MRQRQTFILLGVIVAVLILGVAYAAIQNVTLSVAGNVTATPDQGNFKVAFTNVSAHGNGSSTQRITSDTTAIIDVSGLTSVGNIRHIDFDITNTSTDITAYLSSEISHNNTEYFEVTASLGSTTLEPGKVITTTLYITVELIKTPITGAVSDTITAAIKASPTPIVNTELISFTFSVDANYINSDESGTKNIVLQAEKDMTLGEWLESEYNTVGAYMTTYNDIPCLAVSYEAFGAEPGSIPGELAISLNGGDMTNLEISDGEDFHLAPI